MQIRRLVNFLERPEIVRGQVLAYICIFSLHARLREQYEITYGYEANNGSNQEGGSRKLAVEINGPTKSKEPTNRTGRLLPNIKWRDFPEAPKLFVAFRACTTIWMIYILIRYWFSDYIGAQVSKLIELQLPINCYLIGRFIINQRLAEVTAVIFSGPHLTWRLVNSLVGPYYSGLVNFMLLEEHDIELIYSRLGHNKSLDLEPGIEEHLTSRERLLIDTMCYKIKHPTRLVLRLRANRTPGAHLQLRRIIARTTLIITGLIVLIAIALTISLTILALTDYRYLAAYPGCDPELQKQKDEGQLGPWSMTPRYHHGITILGDLIENVALWLENGFMAAVVGAVPFLLNYDFILHWDGIDRKIKSLNISDRESGLLQTHSSRIPRTTIMKRSNAISGIIVEMDDFFKQYKKASRLLELCLDGCMICCLIMCSSYTYFTRIQGITSLPLDIIAVLVVLTSSINLGFFGHLSVHISCMRSYRNLCSLMVHDLEKRNHNYGVIMEFFETRRTCIKLLKHYPFLPTTFLTVVGWTFSCFFVISELLERNVYYDGKFSMITRKNSTH